MNRHQGVPPADLRITCLRHDEARGMFTAHLCVPGHKPVDVERRVYGNGLWLTAARDEKQRQQEIRAAIRVELNKRVRRAFPDVNPEPQHNDEEPTMATATTSKTSKTSKRSTPKASGKAAGQRTSDGKRHAVTKRVDESIKKQAAKKPTGKNAKATTGKNAAKAAAKSTNGNGKKGKGTCTVRACKSEAHAKGLCPVHYREARKAAAKAA